MVELKIERQSKMVKPRGQDKDMDDEISRTIGDPLRSDQKLEEVLVVRINT